MKEYNKIPAQAVVEVTTSWGRTCLGEIGRDLKEGTVLDGYRNHEFNSLPCLVYQGKTCKKDGTPRKNPKNCSVFQSNLLLVNGEPVKNYGYGEE